jgi:hypothetical protein
MKHGLNHVICMMCGRDPLSSIPQSYLPQMPMTRLAQCFLTGHPRFDSLRRDRMLLRETNDFAGHAPSMSQIANELPITIAFLASKSVIDMSDNQWRPTIGNHAKSVQQGNTIGPATDAYYRSGMTP